MHIFQPSVLLVDQVPPDRFHHSDAIRILYRFFVWSDYDLLESLGRVIAPAAEVLGDDGGTHFVYVFQEAVFYPKLM
jgi:hypothetical protein